MTRVRQSGPLPRLLGVPVHSLQSLIEFTDSFLGFEREHGLLSLTLRGHGFWAYTRYAMFYEILNQRLAYVPPRRWNRRSYAREFAQACAVAVQQSSWTRERHDILLINYDRKKIIEGKAVNPHTYLLSKSLCPDYRVLLLDFHNLVLNRKDYPCDMVSLRPLCIIARIKAALSQFGRSERDLLNDLNGLICQRFGRPVNIFQMARNVFLYQTLLYQEFVRICDAQGAKMVGYCDDGNLQGIIQACHSVGIPSVDFQHSLISYLNIQYNYPECAFQDPPSIVPEYIFSFGPYWDDDFRLPTKVVTAGFPYFDEEFEEHAKKRYADRDNNVIVIADEYSKPEFVRLALELAGLLRGHRIYYKLRPEEYGNWRQRYPAELAATRNITVIDSDEISLYAYFAMCRYQVGTNSTALFEGMPFDLITFILRAGWYEEMRKVYESGAAFLVTGAEEMAQIITGRTQPKRVVAREVLFAQNSLSRTKGLISEVIARGMEERMRTSKVVGMNR